MVTTIVRDDAGGRLTAGPARRVIAIDGCWSDRQDDEKEQTGLFAEHYAPETRAALPAMRLSSPAPLAAMMEPAGSVRVAVSHLTRVHALAEGPPSPEPWYVPGRVSPCAG